MADKRFRLQFKFWLSINKPEEHAIAELIEDLKQQGTFSKAIRDGLRLVADLWQGNIGVLLALFPWVEDAMYRRFLEHQPGQDAAIQDQLARLERMLLEQGNQPVTMGSAPVTTTGGLKSLAVPVVPGPGFDEDDRVELVVKKATSDGKSAENFLDSAFALLG